ncbi:MAG: NUDIX hydrolase [Gemmatimonadaceae bacterium]
MDESARVSSRRVYSGRVLNLDIDRVAFPDGSEGELEIIRHPGASAVIPLLDEPNAANPGVVLIRQYRYAAGGFVYEIPAGRLEPGELPIACARRELEEEAGYRAARIQPLVSILTTPGFTDERIHLFAAWGLTRGEQRHERDEFLEPVEYPFSEVMEMLRRGEIPDAKTAFALLFFAEFCRNH